MKYRQQFDATERIFFSKKKECFMKNRALQIILLSISCFFVSCKGKESQNQFEAKPIVKTVGKIDVMVDPKVEMMMILGRLDKVYPFADLGVNNYGYLDKVDEYFSEYKNNGKIFNNNDMAYQRLPEFGMYLKEDMSDFIMKIDDENFVTTDGPAKNNSYYKTNKYIELVRDFRIKTDFDKFFDENKFVYEKLIRMFEPLLDKLKVDVWFEEFYGTTIENHIKLYVTLLAGNYGIPFKTSDGKENTHVVILADEKRSESIFVYLLAHEFSHPKTINIAEKLYKNEKVKTKLDNLFYADKQFYTMNGYSSGFYVLNETINQACANKFWENLLPKEDVENLNNITVQKQKMIYVPAIAEFLDNYQNNRDKYKTLEDFIPELEKFILTLE